MASQESVGEEENSAVMGGRRVVSRVWSRAERKVPI